MFSLERSLLSPSLEIEAYNAITSVFGISSFTSEPTICMNGWKRGEREPTQNEHKMNARLSPRSMLQGNDVAICVFQLCPAVSGLGDRAE